MPEPDVICKDCRYSCYYYKKFDNKYVCLKNADKWGRIPPEDLKGHHGYYSCGKGERKEDKK